MKHSLCNLTGISFKIQKSYPGTGFHRFHLSKHDVQEKGPSALMVY